MSDHRREPRLVEQHGDEVRIACVRLVELLDRDGAREPRGAEQTAEMNRGHPARSNAVVHEIAADESTGLHVSRHRAYLRDRITDAHEARKGTLFNTESEQTNPNG